jgi:Macrocin-O-methyltransferase (TylF)
MMTADRIRDGLIGVGARVPHKPLRLLDGAANFLIMGHQLHQRGLRAGLQRVATREAVFDLGLHALATVERPLYLEFGVYTGASMRYHAQGLTQPDARLIGFDSFVGLPEDWLPDSPKGHFSTDGAEPDIADDRVKFVAGWFEESLSTFEVPEHDRLLVSIDSDLYSSAATVLSWMSDQIRVGDLIYFDEFSDRYNECRAFIEFLDTSRQSYELVGATRGMAHALFRRVA